MDSLLITVTDSESTTEPSAPCYWDNGDKTEAEGAHQQPKLHLKQK
jgi:hypothetical protein